MTTTRPNNVFVYIGHTRSRPVFPLNSATWTSHVCTLMCHEMFSQGKYT